MLVTPMDRRAKYFRINCNYSSKHYFMKSNFKETEEGIEPLATFVMALLFVMKCS